MAFTWKHDCCRVLATSFDSKTEKSIWEVCLFFWQTVYFVQPVMVLWCGVPPGWSVWLRGGLHWGHDLWWPAGPVHGHPSSGDPNGRRQQGRRQDHSCVLPHPASRQLTRSGRTHMVPPAVRARYGTTAAALVFVFFYCMPFYNSKHLKGKVYWKKQV